MAGWFTRAREKFQAPPEPEVPFAVECDCGGQAIGVRTDRSQLARCETCNTSLFVLPANVYPAPPPPRAPKPKPAPVVDAPPTGKAGKAKGDGDSVTGIHLPGFRKRPRPATPVVEEPAEGFIAPQPWRQRMRSYFTRFNLMLATLLLIVAVTGWGLNYRSRVIHARETLPARIDAGTEAFEKLNFAEAAKQFTAARDAVDLLGQRDPQAMRVRLHSREAVAAAGLVTAELGEALKQFLDREQPTVYEARELRGRWLIADLPVTPVAPERWLRFPLTLQFDFPLQVEARAIKLEVTFPKQPDWWPPEPPARLIFSAPIASVGKPKPPPPVKGETAPELSPEEERTLIVKLNEAGFFPWGTLSHLRKVGWQPFDEIQSVREMETLLQLQRGWQGVEP